VEIPALADDGLAVPVGNRIIVKLPPKKDREGSIILVEKTQQDMEMVMRAGTVVKIGPGCFHDWRLWPGRKPQFKVGDHVTYAKYSGAPLPTSGNDKYRIMSDDDVTAVIPSIEPFREVL